MFDAMMYPMAFLPLGFPVVPWLFRTRSGQRGIWFSTGFVLVALFCLPFLFFGVCDATNCGQGAIAIFLLGPIWITSAALTLISAVIASYSLRPRRPHD